MVYTILISIVFIAELIIAATVIQNLIRLDKVILQANENITNSFLSIKDITSLIKKISEQLIILAEDFVEKTKKNSENFIFKTFSKALISLAIFNLNFKIIKKIKNSKLTKIISKGWSFLESMV